MLINETKNNPLFSKNNECTFLEKGFKINVVYRKRNKIAKAQWLLDHRAFVCFLKQILNVRRILL